MDDGSYYFLTKEDGQEIGKFLNIYYHEERESEIVEALGEFHIPNLLEDMAGQVGVEF